MAVQTQHRMVVHQKIKKKDLLLNNFIGGLAWGLGTVIGATFIFAVLIYVLKLLGLLDFLKQFSPPTN